MDQSRRWRNGLQIALLLGGLALVLFLLLPRSAARVTPQNLDQLHEVLRLAGGAEGSPPSQLSLQANTLLVTSGYADDLWRLDTGARRTMNLQDAGGYTPLVFFSDGRPIAAFQDWATSLRFLDLETGAPIQQFSTSTTDTYGADWNLNPAADLLVYRDGESGLIAADLWTGDPLFRIDAPPPYNTRRPNPTFSDDGSLLAASLIDDNGGNGISFSSFVWDAASGALRLHLGDFPVGASVDSLRFSHDGSLLAVGGGIFTDRKRPASFSYGI